MTECPDQASEEALDRLLLPGTLRDIPPGSDHTAWLQISQFTLTNVRGFVKQGKSETAERLMAHYWKRWWEGSRNV